MILFSFPAAEKKQNAAAAPDAIKVIAMAWPVPAAPAEAEKKVNGDFVLRPKLITNPLIIGKYSAAPKSVNMVKLTIY